VTSAAKFLTPEQRAAEPLAGSLFAIDGVGQGLPEHRFRFATTSPTTPHGAAPT
jgi:hypothetical protein